MITAKKPGFSDILVAIILREMSARYGRRKLSYLWSMIEPAMYCGIALSAYLLMNKTRLVDMSQILFLITGIAPWYFFYRLDQYVRFAFTRNIALLYHPVVSPFWLLLSRMFLEIPTGITFIIVVFLGYSIIFNDPQAIPTNWPPVLGALSLVVLMAYGVGGSIATILLRYEAIGWSLGFLVRLIAMTGGINFVPDYAPPAWQAVIFWNPMTHIIILFRSGFTGAYPAHNLDIMYTVSLLICLVLLSLLLERFMARKWIEAS